MWREEKRNRKPAEGGTTIPYDVNTLVRMTYVVNNARVKAGEAIERAVIN